MKIIEKVTKTVEVEVVKDILCNKCGKTTNYDGLIEVVSKHGYESNYEFDAWCFSLCEDCLIEFMKTFKLRPKLISGWPEGSNDDNLFGHIK